MSEDVDKPMFGPPPGDPSTLVPPLDGQVPAVAVASRRRTGLGLPSWSRVEKASNRTVGRSRSNGRSATGLLSMLGAGLVALLALGAVAVATGIVDVRGGGEHLAAGQAGRASTGSDSYSYYHELTYDPNDDGSDRWNADDRRRSQDPNEAVLGDTSRWEYDGPYEYGAYGSDGMRQRSRGRAVDPLASNIEPLGDVFESQGPTDPSGGQPVGAPPSSWTTPYYDAYAPGYTNPYANRIRMTWGEGYGAGAAGELGP